MAEADTAAAPSAPKPRRMSEDEVKAAFMAYVHDSIGFRDSTVTNDRAKAMDYYLGRPFGNEVEGRSQVVSTDVAETVDWILPSLMRIFTAGDRVVQFQPTGPEDEKVADQATDYCNHIFHSDNAGFVILHNWFKDALLQKNGIVKAWWEEIEDVNHERYQGLTDQEIALLLSDDAVEAVAYTKVEQIGADGAPFALHNVEVKRRKKSGRCRIEGVPPEEFLIARDARSIEAARFVGHRRLMTASELVDQGYRRSLVDTLASGDDMLNTSEAVARRRDQDFQYNSETGDHDQATRRIVVIEGYARMDCDGDGIAELRMIKLAGNTLLENDPIDSVPFADLTPILMPHRWIGRSVAELVMDLQLLKSTVWRQMMDNLYLTNNPRIGVVANQGVNLDDLLTSRPGGIIRMGNANALVPMTVPFTADKSFTMLEYIDSVRERRTGVTSYNQGLDADTLNRTAHGISSIMQASQQRIELIARIFAETGVRRLFRLMLRLVSMHQQAPRMIRLRNAWVPMDPRTWDNEMDCTVAVGLGTGDQQAQLGKVNVLLGWTKLIIADLQGGTLNGPFVTPDRLHRQLAEGVKALGFKDVDAFYAEPQPAQPGAPPQAAAPPPPHVDPVAMAKIQTDQARLQFEQQKHADQMGLEQAKAQGQHQVEMTKAQLEAARIALEAKRSDRGFALDAARADHSAALADAQHVAARTDVARDRLDQEAQAAGLPATDAAHGFMADARGFMAQQVGHTAAQQDAMATLAERMAELAQMHRAAREHAQAPVEVVREGGKVAGTRKRLPDGTVIERPVLRDDGGQITGLA